MYWTNPGTIRTLIEGNISTKCNCFLYNKLYIMTESFIQGYGSVIDSVPYSKHPNSLLNNKFANKVIPDEIGGKKSL